MGSIFTDLSMRLLVPPSADNIKEFALKTSPAASKIEIKRFLESLNGLEVQKVRTLNMQGKKKRRGNCLIARPNYKKADVTLKNPLIISSDIFPVCANEVEATKSMNKQQPSMDKGGEVKALELGANKDFSLRVQPQKQSYHRVKNELCSIGTMGS
ncbi:hypothetical protein PTKIN_Ptkin02bG0149800 [Pterospermum kingtungense]